MFVCQVIYTILIICNICIGLYRAAVGDPSPSEGSFGRFVLAILYCAGVLALAYGAGMFRGWLQH